jgi:hypothetical protein
MLLQEDKVVNALDDGDFPGTILMNIGFGHQSDAKTSLSDWTTARERAKEQNIYQVCYCFQYQFMLINACINTYVIFFVQHEIFNTSIHNHIHLYTP